MGCILKQLRSIQRIYAYALQGHRRGAPWEWEPPDFVLCSEVGLHVFLLFLSFPCWKEGHSLLPVSGSQLIGLAALANFIDFLRCLKLDYSRGPAHVEKWLPRKEAGGCYALGFEAASRRTKASVPWHCSGVHWPLSLQLSILPSLGSRQLPLTALPRAKKTLLFVAR